MTDDQDAIAANQPNESVASTDSGHFYRQPVEWRLDQIIAEIDAQHAGQVAIGFLDIDRFGEIEEAHGWGLADALLKAVETALSNAEQATFSGRYVRDAFMALYPNLSLEDAFLVIERLRQQLSSTAFALESGLEKATITVTFSAGIASYPGEAQTRNEMVTLAEEATRRALENGGNRAALARPVNMTPKTSHYLPPQLDRLRQLAHQQGRAEAELLREALDDLLRKYDQRIARRGLVGLLNRSADDQPATKGGASPGKTLAKK